MGNQRSESGVALLDREPRLIFYLIGKTMLL